MRHALTMIAAAWAGSLGAAPEWEFLSEDEGIRVYRREVAGSPIVAFRGEADMDASPAKVAAVLMDVPRKPEWVHAMLEARVLVQPGPFERVEYNRTDLPWPLSDRDFVFRALCEPEASSGAIRFRLSSVEHADAPPQAGLVRGELVLSAYLLQPLDGGKRTRVEVEVHADPKGSLPKWLVNLFQKKWPARTLAGIRRQVAKPEVKEQEDIVSHFKAAAPKAPGKEGAR